ncbi:MAG: AgmX/PglI C-terminal domain-containing protein [Myxococcota bacterium]
MKFLCGSCRTKYQISDEKVRGKILTIRCKKCGAKIIVRESLARESREGTVVAPVAEGPRSTPSSMTVEGALSQAFNQAMTAGSTDDVPVDLQTERSPESYEWYTAVEGHQAGPFTFKQLNEQIAGGALLGRHYVWHEGMEHWRRIREVETLRTVAERPPSPPPPPGPDLDLALDRTTAEPEVAPMSGIAPSELPTSATPSTLFSDTTPAAGSASVSQALSGGAVPLDLSAGNVAQPAGEEPAPGPSADGSSGSTAAEGEDLFASVPRASEADLVPKESTRFFVNAAGVRGAKRWNRLGIMLGGILVFLAVGTGIGVATGVVRVNIPGIGNPFSGLTGEPELYSGEADDPSSVASLKERKRKASAGPSRSGRRTRNDSAGLPGGYIDDSDGEEGSRESRGLGAESLSLGHLSSSDPVAGVSVGNVELPTADVEIPTVNQSQLSEEAIQKTIAAGRRSLRLCYESGLKGQAGLKGKLEVLVTIQPSGKVSRADIETPAFRGSRVGGCISEKIKGWRFPSFEGEPEVISIPFVLQQAVY